jgi:thiol:disulfide interchange protein
VKTLKTSVLALAALFLVSPLCAAPPAGEKKAAQPPIYDQDMDGMRQIEATAKFCAQSGRRMVVNLGTNDCEPCRVVNRAMHERKFFDVFVQEFGPVFIDVTPGTKNAEILKKFGVDPKKGLPVIVVYDKDVKPVELTGKGEMVELAKKGDDDVRAWFLARLPKGN